MARWINSWFRQPVELVSLCSMHHHADSKFANVDWNTYIYTVKDKNIKYKQPNNMKQIKNMNNKKF